MTSNARRNAVLVMLVIVAVAIGVWVSFFDEDAHPLHEREVATRILAEHVRGNASPKGVLVLANPFARASGRPAEVYDFDRASIAGLKEGFGSEIPLKVVYPELKSQALADPGSIWVDPQSSTPVSFMLAEDAFEKAIAANPDCDVIVSLVGLPVNLAAVKAWTQPGSPRFALLLPDWRMIGSADEVRRVFQSGKVLAAVVRRPGADPGREPVEDSRALFDSQFLLLTSTNLGEVLAQSRIVF